MIQVQISLLIFTVLYFQSYGQKSQNKELNHIVKINIAPIVVGEIMPSYEYIFNDKIALEGGVGIVTENYLSQFIQESNLGQTRQMKIGPCFLISTRYYPFRRGEFIYCKAELKYRRYKEVYQELSSNGGNQIINEYERKIIPRLGTGYHIYLDEHFLFDLSANIGLSFIKEFQFGYTTAVQNTRLHFGIGFNFAYAF